VYGASRPQNMYIIYSVVTAVGMILLSPYFFVRGLISGKYIDHVAERLGWRFPPELQSRDASEDGGAIWIHAVSVGEVLAVLPLAGRIKDRFPRRRLVISTTTKTGQQLARERKQAADAVFYFPMDWRGPARRTLRAVRPAAVIIVETEIWPNFLREMRRANVPVIFVNGRVSERSFRGYQRAFRWSAGTLRAFFRRVLSDATIFLMQSEGDASRLLQLGGDADRVIVTGNLKYDFGVAEPTAFSGWLAETLRRSKHHPVIVAGSVVEGEEPIVLGAFAEVRKRSQNALLVLAPRKPDRFDAAAKIAETAGERVVRRSRIVPEEKDGPTFPEATSVLLLDSVGELASVYALADVVFVGGSLVPSGGHNILEPSACGKAPVFGPSMENFRDMAESFRAAAAGIQVNDAPSLAAAWIALLQDDEKCLRMGAAAREQVERNRGATGRVMDHIEKVMESIRGPA
jgi:3-deoxy-D-manno-octulosonic-acid transferase